jgi:TRAP-type mannitol/chloroaromatic compound transport system permease large subunit
MATQPAASQTWKTVASGIAVAIVVVGAIVVATTGDSWAVRMTLTLVALEVAVRLFRWSRA